MWNNFGNFLLKTTCNKQIVRFRFKIRNPLRKGYKIAGPDLPDLPTKNIEQHLAELNYKDPELYYKVDIGLPPPKALSKEEVAKRRQCVINRKNDLDFERASRKLTLDPSLHDIQEEFKKENAPVEIRRSAEHYGVFDHLFGDAYFTPYVILNIDYPQKGRNLVASVHRGNVIKPSESASEPVVHYESDPETLWTLLLTNPDGHFTEENKEYVHWLIGNIPGNNISKGETVFNYLPPFPPRGLGFQRFIFVLFKQDKKIDYRSLKKTLPRHELSDRTFTTQEFYRERQDLMTPAGLAFFQSDWDLSVKNIYYDILKMEEPIFEYDQDKPYEKPQVWFPWKQPFNRYLDRYRDPRDVNQDRLVKKLRETDPFTYKKPFAYPNAINRKRTASWLEYQTQRERAGFGRTVNRMRIDEYE